MNAISTTHHAPVVRVLHLEDSALDADLVCEFLHMIGMECEIDRVWTRDGFAEALVRTNYDLILADHALPAFDGESALAMARESAAHVPFVFVSGTLGEDVAVEAMKRGATDYVVKQRLDRLPAVVTRALSEAAERAERKRAEAALRDSEANFETLVNAMPQLCWMADAGGRITWYNKRWYDYTGLSPDILDDEDDRRNQVHHPHVLPEVVARWKRSIATGERFEMTFPMRGADGVFRPFLTRVEPVRDAQGHVVRWLGTNTDVSAQFEAEAELKRLNETLESRIVAAIAEREEVLTRLGDMQKMETIGQLTGSVAHDFNNLLTPIVGNLDLLRRQHDGDDRTQKLVSGALQAAERAKMLVSRLLAFARRQILEPRPVDVAVLIEGMRDLLERSLGPRIEVVIEAASNLPAARIDPNQLELAVLNLAVNARDAMPGGGRLSIAIGGGAVGPSDLLALRHGQYVRLVVSDNGTGMDDVTLRRAVEPFYSTKGIGKGTGLGLSMVHGLAAQSGGGLVLDSVLGQGTRAEIWIPVASGPADRSPSGAASTMQQTRPLVVLLVDDEELVRAGTADMLADLGHSVLEASSASYALELLRTGAEPDLLVTDYLMPGMTGAELAAAVRKLRPSLPILLVTGYANLAGDQMANLPLLPKPFRQAELASRIADMFASAPGPAERRAKFRVAE